MKNKPFKNQETETVARVIKYMPFDSKEIEIALRVMSYLDVMYPTQTPFVHVYSQLKSAYEFGNRLKRVHDEYEKLPF